ncbi:ATP-dependent metalloprotease [Chaetoceros tenuissimus]|uniref:ATP-dependent metalloprotease n=1 Tax=Chaetoceros tenuissimus TaxID=426638 RepID=A0AAD3CDD6_9STRA|nr:ATP-dependent metalloprotease [Chaetoceros tenuissimus]
MFRQRKLHAGQLRYHDFSKLREARESQKQLLPSLQVKTCPNFVHIHSPLQQIHTSSLASLSSLNSMSTRSFFTSSLSKKLSTFRLKQLERTANQNPTNASLQYEFLSELIHTYPEAVIHRFEKYPEFALDERCALLYFGALQRTSSMDKFDIKTFMRRVQTQNVSMDPLKIQSLVDLDTKSVKNRSTIATQVMQILSGNVPGVTSGAIAGGALSSGVFHHPRGADPKHPLHVQMQTPQSGRMALLTLAKQVLIAFVVVSAITAVVDEKGLGGRAMGMSNKHVQEAEGSDVRFEDVKGVAEAKAELEEIVEYLKNPEKFTRLGGKLPRGLLLTGPPGTGKTLLAKAIAGEANVPFFFSSGSQFEEVYVGLGAKRVRELFEAAKKKSPAIIFIDEIDAVGGTRKLKDQSALKMTLNELLVQMDGFDENNGVIVIGATNFAEALDEALLRPGRFDKHVTVPLPDVGGRKEILEMYAKKTKIAKDVDLSVLARGTVGFSGADLYNLMNQAALKASTDGLNSITMSVLEYAKDKIMMGAERKTAVITPKTAKVTAFHEAGHALVAVLSEGASPIHKATIMPRGSALGMVTMLPDGDQTSQSLKEMLAFMDVAMGGRVAEELIFGPENVTSGASSDIMNATRTARAMVTKYGFSDKVGIVFHGGNTGEESASGATRAMIDSEVQKLTQDSYQRAKDLLMKYSKEHHLLAETLLEYETLTGDEVRDIIHKRKKPNRPIVNREGGARGDRSVLNDKSNNSEPPKSKFPFPGKVGSRRDNTSS